MTAAVPTVAIKSAMSVARDLAEGKLSPAQLDAEAVAVCRELFGMVDGPDDELWGLHTSIGRQLLAVGCGWITGDELAEWVAVYRAAEEAPASEPSWIEQMLAVGADEDDGSEPVSDL